MTNEIRPPAGFVPPWLKPVGKQGSEKSGKQFRKQLADAFKEDEEEDPSQGDKSKAPANGEAPETKADAGDAQQGKPETTTPADPEKVGRHLNREM